MSMYFMSIPVRYILLSMTIAHMTVSFLSPHRFQKGDIFFIHNDLGDGWLWVTAHRSGDQGLVFRDLLAEFDDNIDPNAVFPWFHRKLTKNEAVELLVRGES